MSEKSKYVFQVFYVDDNLPSNLKQNAYYTIVTSGLFAEFPRIKKRWSEGFCVPEMLLIYYHDDEDDLIPVETEEEFKEFLKFANQSTVRGIAVKLILKKKPHLDLQNSEMMALKENDDTIENEAAAVTKSIEDMPPFIKEWRSVLKEELKKEVIAEIKSEFQVKETKDEELEIDACKFGTKNVRKERKCLLKLDKIEKRCEGKVGYHLEKLDLKKKKCLEKESRKVKIVPAPFPLYDVANGKKSFSAAIGNFNLPLIMSGIATVDSSTVQGCPETGKTFQHIWRIVNDGTIPWECNVELRHKWSSPGLIPDKKAIDCCPLQPGDEKKVTVTFLAPEYVGSFISYWDFYHKYCEEWKPFGHYVSLNGFTKVTSKNGKVLKSVELINLDAKIDEVKSRLVRQFGLESSEIAAEMAREAANAAMRALNKEQSDHPTSNVETSSGGLDSGSDNEANNVLRDVSEDRDFVMVEIPKPMPPASDNTLENGQSMPTGPVAYCGATLHQNDSPGKIHILRPPPPPNVSSGTVVPTPMIMPQVPAASWKLVAPNSNYPPMNNQTLYGGNLVQATADKKEANTVDTQNDLQKKSTENNFKAGVSYMPITKPVVNLCKQHDQVLSHQNLGANINYPVFPRPAPTYPPWSTSYQTSSKQFMPAQNLHFPNGTALHQNDSSGSAIPILRPNVHQSVFPPPPPNVSSATVYPTPMIMPQVPAASWNLVAPNPNYPPMNNQTLYNYTPFNYPSPFGHMPTNHQVDNKTMMNINTQTTTSQEPQAAFGHMPANRQVDNKTMMNINTQTTTSQEPQAASPAVTNKDSSLTTETCTVSERKDAQDDFVTQQLPRETTENNNQLAAETVQILPQRLVDGAINAASTAYSSVCDALNNLRPKDEKDGQEFDPVFENLMAQLMEMGFTNLPRNARLLKTYHNNIDQVINTIVSNPGDVLDID